MAKPVFLCARAAIIVLLPLLPLPARFESFRNCVVILVPVPLMPFVAMTFISLGFASINIYTQVGLVTVMGLISTHGILIVEVASHLRAVRLAPAPE